MSEIETQRFDFNDDEENDLDSTVESFALDDAENDSYEIKSYRENTEEKTWERLSRLARNESEKEFELYNFWMGLGRGRSIKYLAITYNLPESHIDKIATKNNWIRRGGDYDRFQLQERLKLEQDERAKIHKERLEDYRLQQEFLGRSLSSDAAKLAALVNSSLDSLLREGRNLDVRDIPAILNAANKAAEVGRNLQSSALGVDQLLTALEEYED